MSEQSPKRRNTTATASACLPTLDNLPPELLETILSFLDVRTLCTARLVCAHFRGAASRCLHSVKLSVENLRSRPETTLENFPNLSRVSVFGVRPADLVMLAQSPVADAVTHLRAFENLRLVPECGRIPGDSPVLPFPNLMSLTISYADGCAFAFPQTLRELSLERCVTEQTADLVPGLTNLTCLQIDVSQMCKPFEAVTALTALQRLEITYSLPLISLLGELTQLTHLHFKKMWNLSAPGWSPESGVVSLTRLRRLVHLGVEPRGSWDFEQELELVASISTFTSLRSLDLEMRHRPGGSAFKTLWTAPLRQLTALRLETCGAKISFSPRFDLERLQNLSLSFGVGLGRGGVAALRQATGLTRLELCSVDASVGPEELGTALSRMSRLRALSLGSAALFPASFPLKAVGLPTELTRLELYGGCVTTDADLEVCLGLKKLRVLSVSVNSRISPALSNNIFAPALSDCKASEIVIALAKLPELCKLRISARSKILGLLGDDVRARVDAERHDRGWPPLDFLDLSPSQ